MNNLHDVLVDTIKDLYHAEKQLVKALPKLAKAADSEQLSALISEHLSVTEGQVRRLERVFQELGETPKAKVCHGMMGLVEEGKEAIAHKTDSEAAAIDVALICGAQKVEHYEIAAYGSARAFAETLGLQRVVELLQESLDEETEANDLLTALAESEVNGAAVQPPSDDAGRSGKGSGAARPATRQSESSDSIQSRGKKPTSQRGRTPGARRAATSSTRTVGFSRSRR